MMIKQAVIFVLAAGLSLSAAANDPPVKKSENNICHQKGGRYYNKTKNFTPYSSMDACIKSGGRAAKR